MIKWFIDLNLKGKIVIILTYFVILVILSISVLKFDEHQEKKRTIKFMKELVKEGKLTQEQEKALEWLMFEYKPRN